MGEEVTTTTELGNMTQTSVPEPQSLPEQNTAPSAEVQQTPMVSDNSGQFSDSLRNELKSYLDVETEPSQPTADNSVNQQQVQQQQVQQQPDEVAQQTEEEDSDSPVYRDSDGREVIPAIYIDELQRDVTLEEIMEKFKGFDYYHQNALKQAEDAKRINEANNQLQQQRAELQQKLDEFNASKNDPMFKIVKLFQGDEELKREVTRLVSRMRPNGYRSVMNQQKAQEQRQKFEAMQREIENLKNIEAQRAQAVLQQQKNAQVIQASNAINEFVTRRVQELSDMGIKIGDAELKAIADSCVPLVKANGYNYETITSHFDNYFRLLASQGKQLINNYQSVKKSAPPAPPSGGAAPTITPVPVRGREDFESMMASRLSQLMNQF